MSGRFGGRPHPAGSAPLAAVLAGVLTFAPSHAAPVAAQASLIGEAAIEARLYPRRPLLPEQPRQSSVSAWLQPEATLGMTDRVTLRAIARARIDQSDPSRTYVDLREALVEWDGGRTLVRVGVNTVFWGVTESRHLVDVVNQTDYRDDLDGDQKMGQLMVLATLDAGPLGLVDMLVMAPSRAQRYPGPEGRPGVPIPVLHAAASHASDLEQWHVDVAARWSHHAGGIDWALTYFHGTARDPELIPVPAADGPALLPSYDLTGQAGLELQWTQGDWLWKAEAIVRSGQGPTFAAATGGFERTVIGLLGSRADLGILLEYSYDGRDNRTLNIYDQDVFGGLRLSWNDAPGSEILAGVIRDIESGSTLGTLEASRRVADRWTLALTGRLFTAEEGRDPLYWFRRDDYVEVELSYHF